MQDFILKPFLILKNKVSEYLNDEISLNDLKKITGGFGIYPQKTNLFMIRIRLTGGEVSLEQLTNIHNIIKKYKVPYIRLTTRQDMQLHDVNPEVINNILGDLAEKEFVFRGGGGDTFRNITVSYDSGLSKDSVFDVFPYAEKMTEMIYKIDKAFELPRKIKIAFSSDNTDSAFAKWSDLGFIAGRGKNSEAGFTVYIGGGIGRNSSKAIKVFDFINAGNCAKAAVAMINLFSEHGDRVNRSKARIRYIKEKLGEKEFIKLFHEYYQKVSDEYCITNIRDRNYLVHGNKTELFNSKVLSNSESFLQWKKVFTEDSLWENYSIVRIPVSDGNLYPGDLEFLIKILSGFTINRLRINRVHEIIILLENSRINNLYLKLSSYKNEYFTGVNFKNRIISCVGTKVCPIGLIDSRNFAEEISKVLDEYYQNKTSEHYNKLVNNISISGCGNSCGNSDVFSISGKGTRKKINNELQEMCCIKINKEILKNSNKDIEIELAFSEISEKLSTVLNELIFT